MKIHVHHGDLHLTDLRTRIPFKYGIVTMTSTPHAFLRLRVDVDGKDVLGIAADSLPPKWFTKDPHKPLPAEVDEMLLVIEHALQNAIGMRADSPFDAWRQLYEAQAIWGRREKLPPLLTNFGTSLVERALIEATCRATGQPFTALLHANAFGIRLSDLHPSLTGLAPADFLPEKPLTKIILRQTVGLADPLVHADIAPGEQVHDGLPQTFADSIRTYGLRHFKIKVSGALDQDRDRLRRIFREMGNPARDYAFSLDGNEQFHSLAEFRTFWEELLRDTHLQPYFTHLLFVEQPFHRDVALLPAVVGKLKEWPDRPPLIIDESDGEVESLPQALELGYAGTSYKNCKGVFKGLANACLLAQRRREQPAQPAILSGEDLVNIGPVALLQDLTACAALGIASVERNGHHYFAGLSMFPLAVQQQILKAHFDLYHPTREGWPALRIKEGTIQVDSLLSAPFGVGFALNVEQFTPLAVWRQPSATEPRGTEHQQP
jgi:hypothetical protein